jgi:nitrogen regulatory protein P-II 1
MKEIKAYVRRECVAKVLEVLRNEGITNSMLNHVDWTCVDLDVENAKMNIEFGCKVQPMVKLEIMCLDKDERTAVDLIQTAGCTTRPGDGLILVSNINRFVNIQACDEGADAL